MANPINPPTVYPAGAKASARTYGAQPATRTPTVAPPTVGQLWPRGNKQ